MIFLATGVYFTGFFSRTGVKEVLSETPPSVSAAKEAVPFPIETLGESDREDIEDAGISWPGEIVSLGDFDVQPQREGVIVEWSTHIGQNVVKGQPLGKLSPPPKNPELIKMLAEQAEGLAKAKGQSQATIDFAKKNREQLITLRDVFQKNFTSVNNTLTTARGEAESSLSGASQRTLEQMQGVVQIQRQNVRTVIEQMFARHISKFTNVSDPKNYRQGMVRYELGILDSSARNNYETLILRLRDELKKSDVLSTDTALEYAQAAITLLALSVASESLSQSGIDEMRKMAYEDQVNLLDTFKTYEEAKSALSEFTVEYTTRGIEYGLTQLEKEKDYAEQMKEINEKIAMLEREQQMALVEVAAAEASYKTVAASIMEGLVIVAPQSGTISAIYKNNGDFVGPGMPIAVITSGDRVQRFVRFAIPSNLPIPEPGTVLTILRPGYPHNDKKVKLIGIGTALDGNGAFIADAQFADPIDWPVRISVRVLPPSGLITTLLIPFVAVWWDENAQAQVWLVTEQGKIRPQPIQTGRMIGDKIEVVDGMQKGNRYLAEVTPGLSRSMTVADIPTNTSQMSKAQPEEIENQGHDHE